MANITYKFVTRQVGIDSLPTNVTYGTNLANTSNFSSFENANFPGLQRDEKYRFGIVFYDNKMKPSFVKHLADIRIPDVDVIPIMASETFANSVHVEFTVSGLPEEVYAYQIVYVPRTMENRTVIDMGYVNGIGTDGFKPYSSAALFTSETLLEYTSPETLYNKLDIKGEFIQQIGAWSVASAVDINTGTDKLNLIKCKHELLSTLTGGKKTVGITDSQLYRYTPEIDTTVSFGGKSFQGNITTGSLKGVKGTTNMVHLSGLVGDWGGTNVGVLGRRRKGLVNNEPINLYGNVENNVFVPCSDLTLETTNVVTVWGDTYIGFFEFNRAMFDPSVGALGDFNGTRYSEVWFLPVESTINFNFIANPTMNQLVPIDVSGEFTDDDDRFRFMQELKGVHGQGIGYIQDYDLYTYNSVYSRQNNVRTFTTRPSTLREDNRIDTRVYTSDRKINAELEDGWLVFRNFLDVDTTYGKLTRLYSFKNNLYFFQPRGYGVLSIDQRELAQTDTATALTLGVGGVLDRYDYLSTQSGLSHHDAITSSKAGIYYIDSVNKALVAAGEIPTFLSDMSMKSWAKPLTFTNCKVSYDGKFNNILFSVDSQHTLVYSENLQKFTEFYTFNPDKFIQLNNNSLHVSGTGVYTLNPEIRGRFNNTVNPSKISFVIKPEGRLITRLDVIEILTNVLENNVELQETFSSFRVYNSYQDTGPIPITGEVARRRMRNWRINHLRDVTDEGRLKDSYFVLELEFNNASNKLFKLTDIVVSHFPVRPY